MSKKKGTAARKPKGQAKDKVKETPEVAVVDKPEAKGKPKKKLTRAKKILALR